MTASALSSGPADEWGVGGREGRMARVAVLAHCVVPLEARAHNTSAPERAREGCGHDAVR